MLRAPVPRCIELQPDAAPSSAAFSHRRAARERAGTLDRGRGRSSAVVRRDGGRRWRRDPSLPHNIV